MVARRNAVFVVEKRRCAGMSVDWLNLSDAQGDSRTVVDRLMES